MLRDRLKTARRAAVRHARATERAGFSAHEQSLTEVVLTRAASAATVRTFSQRQEARTGADWLWWWEEGGEWFGLLVQAKRNKPKNGMPWYDFEYRSGSGPRQVDLLLKKARQLSVPAAYVVYNRPPIARAVPVSTPCCTGASEGWRTRLGVATLPALVAASLIGREDSAPQYSRPLECLTCSGKRPRLIPAVSASISDRNLSEFLEAASLNLPRAVARGILAQIADLRMGELRLAPSTYSTVDSEVASGRVFTSVPDDRGHRQEPYFEHALRGLRTRPPDYLASLLDGAPIEQVEGQLDGIDGLVVFSQP